MGLASQEFCKLSELSFLFSMACFANSFSDGKYIFQLVTLNCTVFLLAIQHFLLTVQSHLLALLCTATPARYTVQPILLPQLPHLLTAQPHLLAKQPVKFALQHHLLDSCLICSLYSSPSHNLAPSTTVQPICLFFTISNISCLSFFWLYIVHCTAY
jgi:hypothetical protein